MDQHRLIVEAATALASGLPLGTVESVADAILTSDPAALRAEISRRVAHHQQRDRALAFIEGWKRDAAGVPQAVVAVALQTATLSEQQHRDAQTVELVWTGPDVAQNPFRRTEQAILQLLDSAQKRITLVSFAVYNIPNIAAALVKAARRGVILTVIVETPDKLGGENEYSTLRALGSEVANCSSVYYWPKENRRLTEVNKPGILHVKCAVADAEWLFLSSANLTQQAFTVNMELGMLVRGGTMPGRVEEQFRRLIQDGQLRPV
jgi:phosphatidylserine/phosphatidylglycerophosphate/cardiolipin synthase-like enzyme